MSAQSREAKVFAALLVSVTIGAIVLMALGNDPPSVGAFCLSSYNRLDPVERAVIFRQTPSPERWNGIRIYCADVKETGPSGNSTHAAVNNSHFIICNGRFGGDGQIQPTDKWRGQLSITPDGKARADAGTIQICVLVEKTSTGPTEYQLKRTEALAEELSRTFDISPESIVYSRPWR